jgi:predicted MFS family arabinose efflux permease
MLAVVMLINRSGTMVLPFLSIYLTSSLGFSVQQAGYVLSSFGIGSVVGSYLGGAISDRYGHFFVQFFSLIFSGILFILMSKVTEYFHLIAGIVVLSIIAESLRPANAASVSFYARPENVSRAFSLNRMAINLGFSIGPAIGGVLASIAYRWLFIADGTTCILAGIFFFIYFRNRKGFEPHKTRKTPGSPKVISVFKDRRFLIFVFLSSCFAILFFQLFMSLPLFYRDVYGLSENKIGGLLALNGIIVFSLEMILVYILQRRHNIPTLILIGMVILGFSFLLLNLYHHTFILLIAMLLLSLAEIFAMPFMATFVVQQSSESNRGSYMGLYTISFSVAHILAPALGAVVITHYGYHTLWWIICIVSIVIGIGFYYNTSDKRKRI